MNVIRMHYRIDERDGAPWVTFINGIANDTTLWDGQVAALARDFRLLRFDARGHGGPMRWTTWGSPGCAGAVRSA